MNDIKITLVKGERFSGKTTMALAIQDADRASVVLNLATPLKEGISRVTGISLKEMEELKKDESRIVSNGRNMREIMQEVGDAFRDILGENVFTKSAIESIKKIHSRDGVNHFIIGDLRRVDEYELFKDTFQNTTVISVIRPGNKKELTGHRTETEHRLIPSDHIFNNDGSFGKVYSFAKDYLKIKESL
jgi:hypothetical protein